MQDCAGTLDALPTLATKYGLEHKLGSTKRHLDVEIRLLPDSVAVGIMVWVQFKGLCSDDPAAWQTA